MQIAESSSAEKKEPVELFIFRVKFNQTTWAVSMKNLRMILRQFGKSTYKWCKEDSWNVLNPQSHSHINSAEIIVPNLKILFANKVL